MQLEASFLLMTDGQYHNSVTVDAVSGDITAIAVVNQPVPVFFMEIVNGATDTWQLPERLDALDDGFCAISAAVGFFSRRKSRSRSRSRIAAGAKITCDMLAPIPRYPFPN